ncbi:MAG: preprotein translocase subunit YajC [Rhodoluna sp.]|nr:preprotein translocase subunit YajC [Rhodoluna sp.]
METIIVYIAMFAVLGLMWNNSRKRKKAALELQSNLVAGTEVMLTSGIFATIVAINEDRATVSSGTSTLVVAKGAILRVLPATAPVAVAPAKKAPAKKAPAKATKTDK